jgi:hypothetical protein
MKWLGTIIPALPKEEPLVFGVASIRVTSYPLAAVSVATLSPTTPPPIITT